MVDTLDVCPPPDERPKRCVHRATPQTGCCDKARDEIADGVLPGGHMFDIVLYEPEIPPNTGNIMRLAANTGARLHLIEPLGFVLTDRRLRRAGLDYEDRARIFIHASYSDCERTLANRRWFAVSTRGARSYSAARYRAGDVFVFGPETRGLPEAVLGTFSNEQILRLPMLPTSRSLNLANAVAVIVYEAWRQCGFAGAGTAAG